MDHLFVNQLERNTTDRKRQAFTEREREKDKNVKNFSER